MLLGVIFLNYQPETEKYDDDFNIFKRAFFVILLLRFVNYFLDTKSPDGKYIDQIAYNYEEHTRHA